MKMSFLSTEPIGNTSFVLLGKDRNATILLILQDIGLGSLCVVRKSGQELLFIYMKGNVPKGSF